MSALAERPHGTGDPGWRECLARRPQLLYALSRRFPGFGSVELEEAVDSAMVELLEKGCDAESVSRQWRIAAERNLLDAAKSRRVKLQDRTAVEDHQLVGPEELSTPEQTRLHYRWAEMISQLRGDERRWARVALNADPDQAKPGQLAAQLGWTGDKYRHVARSARGQLRSLIAARADGTLCRRRQAVLEAFTQMHLHGEGELGEEQYNVTLLHIKGCLMCERQWRQYERVLLDTRHILAPVPVLLGALAALQAKVALVKAKGAVLLAGVRTRTGASAGGGGAAGGGVVAAIGSKGVVAVCAGALCASAAAGSVLVDGGSGLLAVAADHEPTHLRARRASAQTQRRSSVPIAPTIGPSIGTGVAVQHAAAAVTQPAAGAGSSQAAAGSSTHRSHPHSRARAARVTPGDLMLAAGANSSSTRASSPSGPASSTARAASVTSAPTSSAPPTSPNSSSAGVGGLSGGSGGGSQASHSSSGGGCTPGDLAC